jgi:hypothetical protein
LNPEVMMYRSIFLALALSACVADDLDDVMYEEAEQGLSSTNGVSLNGVSLNGVSLNGVSLNGVSLNGVSLNGTTLTGVRVSANTTTTTTTPLNGTAIVGSKWTATTSNATTLNLRIDSAAAGTGTNADLWFYGISYQTTAGWQPLCGVDGANVPIKALSVVGEWKSVTGDSAAYTATSTNFTVACRGKTIAKCVELGYKTFKRRTTQLTTCVRMLRGDYCGNGVAWTLEGTLLNLYDNIGVQADTEAWTPEAEWTPTGARCVNTNRSQRYDLVFQQDPRCIRLKTPTCGTTFANGAILIDELSPSAVLSIQTAQAPAQ